MGTSLFLCVSYQMRFSADYHPLDLGVLFAPKQYSSASSVAMTTICVNGLFLASTLLNSEGGTNCTLGCSLLRRKGIEGEISQDVASGIRVAGTQDVVSGIRVVP